MGIKQERQTYEDTKHFQNKLFRLIRRKIRTGKTLSLKEREYFPDLVADAMLSQAWHHVYHDTGNGRVDLGSIRFFSLSICDVSGTHIVINDSKYEKRYRVKTSLLWNDFYKKCKEHSQSALQEAIHMSREARKRELGDVREFSSDQRV